jgi:precorrin-2 dehydrogenase / sirohydrochlorin ferrochelatase
VRLYPIMINLGDQRVVVVGGGSVALRKVSSLLESGALVAVISPDLTADLRNLADAGQVEWVPERFEEDLLDRFPDAVLVFGATNHREVNVKIHRAAVQRKIPCNVADVPDLCTFMVPAVITQGELLIAVSTGGSSPALARRIREDLEQQFGPEYAEMTRVMGELRKQVLQTGSTSDENKKLFLAIVNSEILTALRDNNRERALAILKTILPEHVNPDVAIEEQPCPGGHKEA